MGLVATVLGVCGELAAPRALGERATRAPPTTSVEAAPRPKKRSNWSALAPREGAGRGVDVSGAAGAASGEAAGEGGAGWSIARRAAARVPAARRSLVPSVHSSEAMTTATATMVIPIRIIHVGDADVTATPRGSGPAESGVTAAAQADSEDWVDDDGWDLPMDSLRAAAEEPAPAPAPLASHAPAPAEPASTLPPDARETEPGAAPDATVAPPRIDLTYTVYSPEDIVRLAAPRRAGWDAADVLVAAEAAVDRTPIVVALVVGIVLGIALFGTLASF